jgi:homoserine trans-succinylase
MAKHDALKENLYNFYTANKHLSRKEIFDQFIEFGAPERSLNREQVKEIDQIKTQIKTSFKKQFN